MPPDERDGSGGALLPHDLKGETGTTQIDIRHEPTIRLPGAQR